MCENCNYLGGHHHPDCYHFLTPLVEVEVLTVDPITQAKADAWNECIGWFALVGPLNHNQRINTNVLIEAEEANPYEQY